MSGGFLTEEDMAGLRLMRDGSFAACQQRKIRDLARSLHEGRIPAGNPGVQAALRELAGEIREVLGRHLPAEGMEGASQ